MNSKLISGKVLIGYCACLFAVSWTMQLLALATTQGLNDPAMTYWLATTMLTPALVTLVFLAVMPAARAQLQWKPTRKLFLTTFLAVLIPILFAFSILFVFEFLQWGNSRWFQYSDYRVVVAGGPFLLGLGSQNLLFFAVNIFITGLAFALLNTLFAAGEEIAWRGLLQGLLLERLGKWKGVVVLGFLWSMWHLPIQMAGYNYPENPIIGSFIISPLLLITYSFVMARITLLANSFIPAAIMHGAINGIQEGIIADIDLTVPEIYLYLTRVITAVLIAWMVASILKKLNHTSTKSNSFSTQ